MRSGAPWANCAASTAAGLSAPTQAATTTPAAAIIRFALTVAGTSLVGHIGWTHPSPARHSARSRGAAVSGVRSAPRAVLVARQTITSSDGRSHGGHRDRHTVTTTMRLFRPQYFVAAGCSDPPSASGGRLGDRDGAARLPRRSARARLGLVGVVAHTFAQHARDPLRGPPVPALNDGPGRAAPVPCGPRRR